MNVSEEKLTGLGDGLEMGKAEEDQEGGNSWITPRFQFAQLSGRVRWGHWRRQVRRGKIVSLSHDMLSLRNL